MDGGPPSPHITQPAGSAASSPHNPRKRANDEAYDSSPIVQSSPPCYSKISKRPSTAPEQNKLEQMTAPPSFEQNAFGARRSNHAFTAPPLTSATLKPDNTTISPNTKVANGPTFQDAMNHFQDRLDEEYRGFEQKLKQRDQDVELEDFDWDELEARYHTEIDPKVEAEQEIMNECSHLFQYFLIWMQMSSEREADRALKRLRTRMAFVQHSEARLQEKKAHYDKVVNAFHSAMALLGNI